MSSVQEERSVFVPATPTTGIDDLPQSRTEPTAGENAEGGNIDKIREIIFGGQMRDYEKRFIRLETRVIKESTDLREDTKRRFDVLEMFIKREFEALAERLQVEQRHREESGQAVSRTLAETAQALEAKLTQFDEASARAHRDLRQQLLEQSQSLSAEIQRKHAEMSTIVEREVANLNSDKPSRTHLAAMFTELAARLSADLKDAAEV